MKNVTHLALLGLAVLLLASFAVLGTAKTLKTEPMPAGWTEISQNKHQELLEEQNRQLKRIANALEQIEKNTRK